MFIKSAFSKSVNCFHFTIQCATALPSRYLLVVIIQVTKSDVYDLDSPIVGCGSSELILSTKVALILSASCSSSSNVLFNGLYISFDTIYAINANNTFYTIITFSAIKTANLNHGFKYFKSIK